MSFRIASINIGASSPALRVFVGSGGGGGGGGGGEGGSGGGGIADRIEADAYTLAIDLAQSIGIKADSVRAEISRRDVGPLVAVPKLKQYLVEQKLVPTRTGKMLFVKSAAWLKLLQSRVTEEEMQSINNQLDRLLHPQGSEMDANAPPPIATLSPNEVVIKYSEFNSDIFTNEEDDRDGRYLKDQHEEDIIDKDDNGNDVVPMAVNSSSSSSSLAGDPSVRALDSSGSSSSSASFSSSLDSSSSSSSSSASSSSSDEAPLAYELPNGVGEWVMTDPVIPDQFTVGDYSKSYALKSYDTPRSLHKELKKLRKWWTKDRNTERKSKPVSETTAEKREERLRCFLGFVHQYDCIDGSPSKLTLGLLLNHTLFESYIEYLKQVRKCSDGTIGEALTAAISCCKWLYRKHNYNAAAKEPSILRRLKDWRNSYQAKAARTRAQDDVEELTEQGKWLDWDQFIEVVQRLRTEWSAALEDDEGAQVTTKRARQLHDVLLLGLYACIPGRGAEVRLLKHIPGDVIVESKGALTFKKYVEREQMNLITQVNGTWKMYVSQYKNSRFHGVDCTELTKDNFGWWIGLLEQYLNQGYRAKLVGEKEDHGYVFMTRNGGPFTQSYFSEFITTLLFTHTNKRVATNILRSSFVTAFYSSDASKDVRMQASVASVMRHSVQQAQSTYDRRSSSLRKREGLELLGSLASKKAATVAAIAPPPLAPQNARAMVVQYQRQPFEVIRIEEDGDHYIVAQMARSPTSNAPVYYTPLNAKYQSVLIKECTPLNGKWNADNEYLLH